MNRRLTRFQARAWFWAAASALLASTIQAQSPAVMSAQNGIGRLGPAPAATVLMPFFEVDLDLPGTTEMTITNAVAAPVVGHVTFWTNLRVPTLDFDIFLSGFDTLTIDIDEIFRTGAIPTYGPTVSNQGPYSEPNENPFGCSFPLPSQIPPTLLNYIQAAHTGNEIPPGFGNSGLCMGLETGRIVEGYVTLDVVNQCSLAFPQNNMYFSDGGQGFASNNNYLWGTYKTKVAGFPAAVEEPLVHIEARDSLQDGFWEDGNFTFYGNFVGASARDNREPLATSWGLYYDSQVLEATATRLVYWRDSGERQQSFTCGNLPAPFSLDLSRMIAFDEEENAVELMTNFPGIPWGSGWRLAADLGPLFERGWLYVDFSNIKDGPLAPIGQAFLGVVATTNNNITSWNATPFDNALAPRPISTMDTLIFEDGFESGDTTSWANIFHLAIPSLPPSTAAQYLPEPREPRHEISDKKRIEGAPR